MGASSILSNVRLDKRDISILINNQRVITNLNKFGAILADGAQVGCGAVINPGSVISKNTMILPLSVVNGYL